jgi:hypothetical protein
VGVSSLWNDYIYILNIEIILYTRSFYYDFYDFYDSYCINSPEYRIYIYIVYNVRILYHNMMYSCGKPSNTPFAFGDG